MKIIVSGCLLPEERIRRKPKKQVLKSQLWSKRNSKKEPNDRERCWEGRTKKEDSPMSAGRNRGCKGSRQWRGMSLGHRCSGRGQSWSPHSNIEKAKCPQGASSGSATTCLCDLGLLGKRGAHRRQIPSVVRVTGFQFWLHHLAHTWPCATDSTSLLSWVPCL